MTAGRRIWEGLRRLRDIGVPAGMPPEDAKYIWVSNLAAVFGILFWVPFLLMRLIEFRPTLAAIYAGCMGLPLLTLALNRYGRHFWARLSLPVMVALGLVVGSPLFGREVHAHLILMVLAGFPAIAWPRRETRWMLGIVALNVVCYHLILILYRRVDPIFSFSPHDLARARLLIEYGAYAIVITLALIGRFGVIQAEDMLKAEQEKLAEANARVSRLSDRLSAYLPHQFVEALARGEKEEARAHRRRRLTIFFSDVAGFTAWTDKMEPEEVHEILNHYFSEMCAIAAQWGGTVDKFIGDALMIFFGDPVATDDRDHALRCVRMALAMQSKMGELRGRWSDRGYEDTLRIRIGINTGYATVGAFGSETRLSYTALGGAVNLASRLESACALDMIAISHSTYALVKDEIVCEARGEIEAKGFTEPVKIYQVVGEKGRSKGEKVER